MSGGEVTCDERRRQRSALMQQATSFSASAQSPGYFDRLCGRDASLPLPTVPERAILRPTTTGNPGNVG